MSLRNREKGLLTKVNQIDFRELDRLLLDATRKTFCAVMDEHPDETFYTFALCYGDADKLDIVPACNSEEGLLRYGTLTSADRDQQTLDWFYARWSFPDWAYAYYGFDDAFAPVTAWIEDHLQPFLGVVTDEGDAAFLIALERTERACVKIMQALDQDGVFGAGTARERVMLNVVDKDTIYVEDELSYAYLLNPVSTYERWRIGFEMYQHALRGLS